MNRSGSVLPYSELAVSNETTFGRRRRDMGLLNAVQSRDPGMATEGRPRLNRDTARMGSNAPPRRHPRRPRRGRSLLSANPPQAHRGYPTLAYFVGGVASVIPWSCWTETIKKPSSSGDRRALMSGKDSQESRTRGLSCPCRIAGVARLVCVHLTGRTSVHAI